MGSQFTAGDPVMLLAAKLALGVGTVQDAQLLRALQEERRAGAEDGYFLADSK